MARQAPEIPTDDGTCRPLLKRSVSLPLITLYGPGTTIGAGRVGLFVPVSPT